MTSNITDIFDTKMGTPAALSCGLQSAVPWTLYSDHFSVHLSAEMAIDLRINSFRGVLSCESIWIRRCSQTLGSLALTIFCKLLSHN